MEGPEIASRLDDAIRAVYAEAGLPMPVAWIIITAAVPDETGGTHYHRFTAPGQPVHVDRGLTAMADDWDDDDEED